MARRGVQNSHSTPGYGARAGATAVCLNALFEIDDLPFPSASVLSPSKGHHLALASPRPPCPAVACPSFLTKGLASEARKESPRSPYRLRGCGEGALPMINHSRALRCFDQGEERPRRPRRPRGMGCGREGKSTSAFGPWARSHASRVSVISSPEKAIITDGIRDSPVIWSL